MDILQGLLQGFSVILEPTQSLLLLSRVLHRHLDRGAAGGRTAGCAVGAAAGDVRAAAGSWRRHALRHLLRRHVRGIDHVDPGQHSGRGGIGRDLPRWARRWRGRGGPARPSALPPSDRSSPGTLSVVGLTLFSPLLTSVALKFGPPENFAVIALGFVATVFMVQGSASKGFIVMALGVICACIGIDQVNGKERFTFGCGQSDQRLRSRARSHRPLRRVRDPGQHGAEPPARP